MFERPVRFIILAKMQRQAGYIIESLPRLFAGSQRQYVEGLARALSFFDLKTHNDLTVKNLDPYAVVVHNIILRGLPTLAPTFIEDIISATFLKTRKEYNEQRGSFSYDFINDELKDEIFRALHIIDPRVDIEKLKQIYTFEDDPEVVMKKTFLFDIVANQLGEHFVQLFALNREYSSIFNRHPRYAEAARRLNLIGQSVDFSIELPYREDNQPVGIAIELEKKLLDDRNALSIDRKNELFNAIDWANLLYIKQSDLHNPEVLQPLIDFSYLSYFEILRKNYERPLYNTIAGIDGLQIALTPFEVARIQRTVLDYILAGLLDLKAKSWKIAVIERDIPGAFLAMQDLKQQFNNLYVLSGSKRSFPEIELSLFYSPEFESAELNVLYQGEKFSLEEFDPSQKYDLVIDSSILRYSGLDTGTVTTKSENLAVLRSCRYRDSGRKFLTAEPVKYKKFVNVEAKTLKAKQKQERLQESLMYFVKNIFRFYELKDKQLEVLSAVLSGENTIADLPFVYEKTLLYQIAAILQSGLTLVISPLYTVQRDLMRKLSIYRIDTCSYVNSTYSDVYEYKAQINKLVDGRSLILFSSAEALHIDDFRKILNRLKLQNLTFSLVVIDQIHSASPWSYMFNYAYYTLSKTLEKVLPANGHYTVFGLTSSASYDVLEDLKILFSVGDKNIIREFYGFENIDFHFVRTGEDELYTAKKIDYGKIESEKLEVLADDEKIGLRQGTLVYTLKARKVYRELASKAYDKQVTWFDTRPHTRVFFATRRLAEDSYENFLRFLNNEADILVANRPVAFGLDKPDLRRIAIASLPPGVEEFIQLVMRAGRDLSDADVFVIMTMTKVLYDRLGYTLSGSQLTPTRETRQALYDEFENIRLLDVLYGNMQKDFKLLDEVLNKSTQVSDTLEEIFIRRVKQDFDVWIYFELQPIVEPTMLYVYDQEELLGYIDLVGDRIVVEAGGMKKKLAERILGFLDFEIKSIVAKPRDIFLILRDPLNVGEKISLVRKLVNLKEGEQTTLTLEFHNNVPKQIADLFPESDLSVNQVVQVYEQTYSFDEFVAALKQLVSAKELRQKEDELRELYIGFRDFFDTYRIVYYLITVGLVEDYLIDLRNQCFVLVLKKHSDEQYLNRIYKRILPFITKERALEVFEKTPRLEGETFVQKVANYWIYFDHTSIQRKHYQTVEDLSRLLQWAAKTGNPSENLKRYLSSYFDAKYLIDIEQKMEEYKNDWMKIIDFFIRKIGAFKDNWYHLLHSAEKILNVQPSNFVARMLKGWATLILSDDNDHISKALDDIALGLTNWRLQTGTSLEKFLEKIQEFYDVLETINYDLKAKAENIFPLKLINTWLEDFNKKFIDIT